MKLVLTLFFLVYGVCINTLNAKVKPPKSAASHKVQFVFADSLTGWAIGSIKTGGALKDSLNPKALFITGILKTYDGGLNWELQTVLGAEENGWEVRATVSLNRTHVWAILSKPNSDQNVLLRTTDGRRWTMQSLKLADGDPIQICFSDPVNGFMILREFMGSTILRTTDGGATWATFEPGLGSDYRGVAFDGTSWYVLAQSRTKPEVVTVLRSDDNGNILIEAETFNPESNDHILEGFGIRAHKNKISIMLRDIDSKTRETSRWILMQSEDRFVSHTSQAFQYEKEFKSPSDIQNFSIDHSIYVLDRSEEYEPGLPDAKIRYNLIRSVDEGKSWIPIPEFRFPVLALQTVGDDVLISANDGNLYKFNYITGIYQTASVDLKKAFLNPPQVGTESVAENGENIFDLGHDEFEKELVYESKWESANDSAFAESFSSVRDANKYKPDAKAEFSVGIDSITSIGVVLHRRTRMGSKHQAINLINEELQKGEIRLRKYKPITFKGTVRSTGTRFPVKYSWSSSISGELSDQIEFTTSPRQLPPGVHYVFFKAQDNLGTWSNPVVVKVIVDDFPKYKFPFHGNWVLGGGGSHYNIGHHIRTVPYGIDVNNIEQGYGGDADIGFPIRASTDGIVSLAGYIKGYGRTVKIDYMYGGKKYTTLVSHLSTISVEVGEYVKQGQEVGTVGSTGRSSAPHIHWELRVDGANLPPEPIFENDTTILQKLPNGLHVSSDNIYEPEHIVIVPEPEIPGTQWDHRGYHHGYRYMWITRGKPTVEAVWKPKLPKSGSYKIQVHIPKKFADGVAFYRVSTKNGIDTVKVNQSKYTDEWITLGVYELDKNDEISVMLNNSTPQGKGSVAFDDVRFVGQWDTYSKKGFNKPIQ